MQAGQCAGVSGSGDCVGNGWSPHWLPPDAVRENVDQLIRRVAIDQGERTGGVVGLRCTAPHNLDVGDRVLVKVGPFDGYARIVSIPNARWFTFPMAGNDVARRAVSGWVADLRETLCPLCVLRRSFDAGLMSAAKAQRIADRLRGFNCFQPGHVPSTGHTHMLDFDAESLDGSRDPSQPPGDDERGY